MERSSKPQVGGSNPSGRASKKHYKGRLFSSLQSSHPRSSNRFVRVLSGSRLESPSGDLFLPRRDAARFPTARTPRKRTTRVNPLPAMQFYVNDWKKDPGLRACRALSRGVWIDLMAVMHECTPYGHLRIGPDGMNVLAVDPEVLIAAAGQDRSDVPMEPIATIGRMISCSFDETVEGLAELILKGVASVTDDGTIYSRRMVRDAMARAAQAAHGHEGASFGIQGGRPRKSTSKTPPGVSVRIGSAPIKSTHPTPPSVNCKNPPSSSSSSSVSSSSSKKKQHRAEGATRAPKARDADTLPLGPIACQSPPDPEFPDLETPYKRSGYLLAKFEQLRSGWEREQYLAACGEASASGASPPAEPVARSPNWAKDRIPLEPLVRTRTVTEVRDRMFEYFDQRRPPFSVRDFVEWLTSPECSSVGLCAEARGP